ncbi:hypothetical protein DDR33_08920 [Pararcticibacter amylolyticus]|uniref:Uncharacterized protein n=1 Tax=Pararcticibacter amylolyticus TaxID=2173175 RepID=A0A2U2PI35_9SPHI|nr:hypothetical protein DDR33_08920 [Pararcticibacter amylolyticus]
MKRIILVYSGKRLYNKLYPSLKKLYAKKECMKTKRGILPASLKTRLLERTTRKIAENSRAATCGLAH